MAMGLTNSTSTFQRFIKDILSDFLYKFCVAYVDDILVYSSTFEDHIKHLRLIFEKLKEVGLVVNPEKCTMASDTIIFSAT